MEEEHRAGEGIEDVTWTLEEMRHEVAHVLQTRVQLAIGALAFVELLAQSVQRVVRQEGSPVVDAIYGDKTADGDGLVGVGFGEGERGGEGGAEVAAVEVEGTTLQTGVAVCDGWLRGEVVD